VNWILSDTLNIHDGLVLESIFLWCSTSLDGKVTSTQLPDSIVDLMQLIRKSRWQLEFQVSLVHNSSGDEVN